MMGKVDLGFAELSSYTQYRKESVTDYLDSDYSSASILALSLPEKDRIVSQEFLLNSKGSGPLQYTGGVFLFEHKIDAIVGLAAGNNNFLPFSATGAKTRTYAAFFDETYEVVHNLFLTAGLRISHDEVRDPYYQTTPGVPGILTFQPDYKANKLSPRFVIRYKPTEQSSVYASFTKGYKSAIPDFRSTSGAPYLKPENINAYEIGYKFANSVLSADVAAFYYDYKNLQNGYYRVGETILSNAANSKIKGADGSLKYRVGGGFDLSAAATYLEASYQSYRNAGFFTPSIIGGVFFGFDTSHTADVSGNQMARAPKWTTTLGGSYTKDLAGGTLVASANYYHTSTIFFDPAHQFAQPSYDLLGARLEWTDPSNRYSVAVFGDNITDSKYITQANVGLVAAGKVWGAPATYGVSFRLKM
jgi:iron complex outermembrane receptor protein